MFLSCKGWLLLPLLFIASFLHSQEIAPYSRFGIGEPYSSAFTASKGMGRLSAGYRDPLHINPINPASYSNIGLTTLETGFNLNTRRITDGQTQKSFSTGDGFLDYFSLGFPASSKFGTSFGIIPYSKMNYSFSETRNDTTIGETTRLYDGSGRTYRLYAGAAWRTPNSDTSKHTFSVGLNFVYAFGNLTRNDIVDFQDRSFYNTQIVSVARLSNFALNPGIQYRRKMNDSLSVVIGAYSSFPVFVNSEETIDWSRFVSVTGGSIIVDTAYQYSERNKNIKVPVEAGVGMTIGNDSKWSAGVDARYSVWKDAEVFSSEALLKNSMEISAGGEFRPDFTSKNIFKNMVYRAGAYYDNGYLEVDKQRISEYGFTFGFSILPVKTVLYKLNFSFDTGKSGTTSNGLLSETFFRAYIGFTLNAAGSDRWFMKPKYD